jgi:type VI secretion system secreted protein Hcp
MKKYQPLLLLVVLLAMAGSAKSQTKIYLKLDTIKGESSDRAHKEWMDVSSFQEGVSSTSVVGIGGGSGKASFQDLKIVKHIDRSTPQLYLFAASGRHLSTASLELVTNEKLSYIITLNDIAITSVTNTMQDGNVQEEVHIAFGSIIFEVRENNVSTKSGWDLRNSKSL